METRFNEDHAVKLRRPFATLAVKFLPVGKVDRRGRMSFLTYIDSSLVIERLTEVDPCWASHGAWIAAEPGDPIGLKHGAPRETWIELMGVRRYGTGQLAMREDWNTKQSVPPKPDDKHIKAAESDAFKRAALSFEVGAYLRNMGDNFQLPEEQGGDKLWWGFEKTENGKTVKKFGGLNASGKKQLRAMYERIVTHPEFVKRYGVPQAYGALDLELEDDVPVPEEESIAQPQLLVLMLLSRFTGRDTSEAYVRATYEQRPFVKSLPQVLGAVKAHLGVSSEDAERLRAHAIQAGEGSDGALAQLEDGLDTLAALATSENELEAMVDETVAEIAGQEEMPV